MAKTNKLGIDYNFNGDSLSSNSKEFRRAVKEVMIYNFTQTFKEGDDPVVVIENVAEDLGELIEEYVITAKVTIPEATINTDVNTTVATTVATAGTALAQAGTGAGAGTGTGLQVGDVEVSKNLVDEDFKLIGGGLS